MLRLFRSDPASLTNCAGYLTRQLLCHTLAFDRRGAPVLGVCDGFGEEDADVSVVEFVDRLAALGLADDQAGVAQHAELLGDGRLFHLDGPGEFFDRAGSGRQAAEDPHAAGGGERLHRVGDLARGAAAEGQEVDLVSSAHKHRMAQTHAPPCMISGMLDGQANVRRQVGAREIKRIAMDEEPRSSRISAFACGSLLA
jgi:hypothetical protein